MRDGRATESKTEMMGCFFKRYGDHRDLHVLTHSFPTRRSSDLWASTWKANSWVGTNWRRDVSRPTSSRPVRVGTREPSGRSEEHTSELQSLMRISYAVFCLKKKTCDMLVLNLSFQALCLLVLLIPSLVSFQLL